jgi:hypothetical protein
MQWKELAAASHYQTAVAIKNELSKGDFEEASAGIEELTEALGRSEKRALKSQLERLMVHIIKWKIQPERRSGSWIVAIKDAKHQIEGIQEDTPSLTDDVILDMWTRCFHHAKNMVVAETGLPCKLKDIMWDEVFEKEYSL